MNRVNLEEFLDSSNNLLTVILLVLVVILFCNILKWYKHNSVYLSSSTKNVKDEGCGEGLLTKNEVDENVLNNFLLGAQLVTRIYPQVPEQM